MTRTVQPHSVSMLKETGKDLTGDKVETEFDISFLLSLEDSLINLSIALSKMDNVQNNLCKKLTKLEQIVRNI